MEVLRDDRGHPLYHFTTLNINETFPDFTSSRNQSQYFGSPLHLTLQLIESQSPFEETIENVFSYGPDPIVEIIQPLRTIARYIMCCWSVFSPLSSLEG